VVLVALALTGLGVSSIRDTIQRAGPAASPPAASPPAASPSATRPAPPTPGTPRPTPSSSRPTSGGPTPSQRPKNGPMPAPEDEDDADAATMRSTFYRARPAGTMRCADADPSRMSAKQRRAWAKTTVSTCLMAYWSPAFTKATGYTLPTPKLVLIDGRTVKTPCGSTTSSSNEAFFCAGNDTIYLWSRNMANDNPRIATTYFVLAHEFGHHLQWAAGILAGSRGLRAIHPDRETQLSRRTELQASCLGGRFLGAIGSSLSRFDRSGFPGNVVTGDRPGSRRTHGNVTNNRYWMGAGYRSTSVSACNTFTASAKRVA